MTVAPPSKASAALGVDKDLTVAQVLLHLGSAAVITQL